MSVPKNLRRDTGGLAPGQIGGHRKRVLSDADADWLRDRVRSGHSPCAS
ncbi:hypothetical protein [Bradyrhizobium sp. Arg816]|nr:hypothetical protein [Bradyrhizobium sp. Arg816]MDI3567169.1 hypothetical protein [Bradyrhizobium sp. Arg816]